MAFTVTATQSGTTVASMLLRLYVLTGAAVTQNGAVKATLFGAAVTSDTDSITTTQTNSRVYGASIIQSSDSTVAAAALTTVVDKQNDATDTQTYVTFKATSLTGTPGATTLGYTTTGGHTNVQSAMAEILTAGTLAEDASSPAVAYAPSVTTITTASFTPPAGSLLVACVASSAGAAGLTIAMSDTSGLGLSWTRLVQENASNGCAGIWVAQLGVAGALALDGASPAVKVDAGAGSSGTTPYAFTSNAFTPPGGTVVIVTYETGADPSGVTYDLSGTYPQITDSLGGHLNWSQVASVVDNAASPNPHRIAVWWAYAGAVTPGSMTVTCTDRATAGIIGNGGTIAVKIWDNANLGGPIGALSAVGNYASNTTLSVVMTPTTVGSALFLAACTDGTASSTAGTGMVVTDSSGAHYIQEWPGTLTTSLAPVTLTQTVGTAAEWQYVAYEVLPSARAWAEQVVRPQRGRSRVDRRQRPWPPPASPFIVDSTGATAAGAADTGAAAVTQAVTGTAPGATAVSDAVTQIATATSAGAGSAAAQSTQISAATSAGAGAVTAVVTQIAPAAAAGAGSVTAAGASSGAATGTAAGAASVTALATQIAPAAAAGAGAVTATAVQAAGTSAAGAAAVTAFATQIAPGSPAGAGSVTDAVTQIATATSAGAGSVAAAGASSGAATGTAAGAGAVTATAVQAATGTTAGTGSAATTAVQAAKATAAGAGTVTAAGAVTGTASITAAGSATAKAAQAAVAVPAGAATLAALAAQAAAAAITGTAAATAAGTVQLAFTVGTLTSATTAGAAAGGILTASDQRTGGPS